MLLLLLRTPPQMKHACAMLPFNMHSLLTRKTPAQQVATDSTATFGAPLATCRRRRTTTTDEDTAAMLVNMHICSPERLSTAGGNRFQGHHLALPDHMLLLLLHHHR